MKRVLAITAALVAVTACSVMDSGAFKEIPDNEFPAGLRVTLPPTTTSSTVPVTEPGPTTTEPTSTQPSAPLEVVQVFYVQGTGVRAVSVEERVPVLTQRKLFNLTGRRGMVSNQLRLASVLDVGAVLAGTLDGRGVIHIELGSTLENVLPEDLPLFFAQIVLTVLSPSRQGQVLFTEEDKPYSPVKADQTVLEPGASVAWEDYSDLILGDPQPPVSTTTSLPSPP